MNINKIGSYSFANIDLANFQAEFINSRKIKIDELISLSKFDQFSSVQNSFEIISHNINNEFVTNFSNRPQIANGFETSFFLNWIMSMYSKGVEIEKKDMSIIDKLQKKIEVFSRVYDFYDSDVKKKSENFSNSINYILLSIVLCLRFREKGDFRDFNTFLKINDLFVFNFLTIEIKHAKLLLYCLALENILISKHNDL